jgi:hypothetical protein
MAINWDEQSLVVYRFRRWRNILVLYFEGTDDEDRHFRAEVYAGRSRTGDPPSGSASPVKVRKSKDTKDDESKVKAARDVLREWVLTRVEELERAECQRLVAKRQADLTELQRLRPEDLERSKVRPNEADLLLVAWADPGLLALVKSANNKFSSLWKGIEGALAIAKSMQRDEEAWDSSLHQEWKSLPPPPRDEA